MMDIMGLFDRELASPQRRWMPVILAFVPHRLEQARIGNQGRSNWKRFILWSLLFEFW